VGRLPLQARIGRESDAHGGHLPTGSTTGLSTACTRNGGVADEGRKPTTDPDRPMTVSAKARTLPALVQVEDSAAWHEALMGLPDPHPLQSWHWGQFKSRWGWSARPLLFNVHGGASQEPPQAAALVLKRRLPGLPVSILYVPKGPLLDYNNGPLRRVILGQLEQLARAERALFIKIDPDVVWSWGLEEERLSPLGGAFVEELKARGWRFSDEQIQFRNTVELDLRLSAEDLLAAMKQKTRYNIRLAERKGVTVRAGTPEDYENIVAMYQETADRDNFTIRPPAYYLDIWRTFHEAGLAQPFIAEHGGYPLGAVIVVRYGPKAIYMYGASTGEERQRMPGTRPARSCCWRPCD
jgi:peptidoglycan pentaglycine glycine transferase (the first glycine)